MKDKIARLCRRLNYTFQTEAYLKQALTHCSASNDNNERFEFLGDAILSAVISQALFQICTTQNEGELSRLRASLVKGDMLATIALELQLGDCLYLGQGELKSGGFRRASILADALEAVFAAVFLDGGFVAAEQTILHVYHTRLHDPALQHALKDPKTQLQEFLQSKKMPLPQYTLIHVIETAQTQTFKVSCSHAKSQLVTTGEASTRKKAEQIAAMHLLTALKP